MYIDHLNQNMKPVAPTALSFVDRVDVSRSLFHGVECYGDSVVYIIHADLKTCLE